MSISEDLSLSELMSKHITSYYPCTGCLNRLLILLETINDIDAKVKLNLKIRGGGTGCAGCANAHPIFDKMAIETSFQQKKENPSEID